MKVTVMDMEERKTELEVSPEWTVGNLKDKVCQRTGSASDDFRLIFMGKTLQEDERLDANNIVDGSTIHLVVRTIGGSLLDSISSHYDF